MISRRKMFLALSAVAVAQRIVAQESPPLLRALALNHAALAVSDPARSLEFYQQLFGMPIQARRGTKTILRIGGGPQFMAIEPVDAGQAPRISRLGMAIADFDVNRVVAELEASGIGPDGVSVVAGGARVGGREIYLRAPGGIVVQIVDRAYCGGSAASRNECGEPEASPVNGLIKLRDLSHFTNYVSEPERSVRFFEDIFGLTVQAYQASNPVLGVGNGPQFLMFVTGFGGIAAPDTPGQGSINHVCFTVEDFDRETILRTLTGYGIRAKADNESPFEPLRHSVTMRMPDRGGAPEGTPELYVTDPDGLRIQLQDTSYCGGGGVLGNICA